MCKLKKSWYPPIHERRECKHKIMVNRKQTGAVQEDKFDEKYPFCEFVEIQQKQAYRISMFNVFMLEMYAANGRFFVF